SDLDAGDGRISAAMRRTQGSPTAEPPAGTGNPASARAAQPAPRVGPTSNRPAGRAEAGGASAAASSGEAQRARPPQPRPEPRPEPRPQSEPARRAGQHGEPGEETRDELEIARAVVGRASGPDIDGTTTGEASRSPAGGAQGGAQGGPRSGMSPPPQRRAGVTPEPRRRASADAPAPAAPPAPPAAADGGRQRAGRSDSGRGAAAASASGQFVVLNVLAPVGGRFEGPALVEALQLVGLRYGDMQVFHFRAPGQPGTSASLFSVLNVIKPGTLVPERMQNSNTPGVAFVMTLPPPYETPARAFETMYGVARALSDELGGRLCDETRSTLSAQALNHMRERMIEFERRSRLR
ncbi:MAG: cell division protein ZipA C-terminal FtsZ-binding domain-containing protein, partial [Gammaproteobacteria bacterium]|nr:cell division protein ZipA C-terminal FtsZ-binding domain-containing protein [Gammaproteobacteria bacterium]